MSYIRLKNITKSYGVGDAQRYVLQNISIEINHQEIVAIMGPSGSGKSTLLNILGCLDSPDQGEMMIDNLLTHQLSKTELAQIRSQKIGFVFQNFALLKEYTALENVELALHYQKKSKSTIKQIAKDALINVGLIDHMSKLPNQLSGGQQQRVAIARAIAGEPSILLADEPTGALDQKNGREIMELFTSIRELGKTIIIVTHDPNVAAYCDRTVLVQDGQFVTEETSSYDKNHLVYSNS